ncbi:probable cation-transporting ATPase 13A3 [Anneissia japonica]|uniref:probable cation-transporting ATPase 13A3 n=1 Tax=Anneissia japonica TaxID=1529436 RepID=UPI0014257093|nr:probable cation-transporting ATPase 13A3 [Anneissia japonica]
MLERDRTTLNFGSEEQLECTGYHRVPWKQLISVLLSIVSLGVLQLVFYWKEVWRVKFTCSPCPLKDAQVVLLNDNFQQVFPAEVKVISLKQSLESYIQHERHGSCKKVHVGSGGDRASFSAEDISEQDTDLLINELPEQKVAHQMIYFEYQKVKYFWNKVEENYERLTAFDIDTPCSKFYVDSKGISQDEQKNKQQIYGYNAIVVEVKSYGKLLIEEVLNPFYIFQIFSVILWFCEDYYYYAACIIVISAISLVISLYETHKQAVTLRDMVAQSSIVTVQRSSGAVCEIDSSELVPGDVLLVPPNGCMMSCDAVLIAGNCIVNESMLTGESVPVTKTPLPNHPGADVCYSPDIHKRHTLFCGTQVIQTRYYGGERVCAVVARTGFETAKGELVRSILYPKNLGFKFYQDALRFVMVLGCLAVIGLVYTIPVLLRNKAHVKDIIYKSLDIITIAVPPALPAAMTVGTIYAQSRLKKAGIFCISPQRINMCGKLKLVCFDKTGTLTEDGLDMLGVVPIQDDHFLPLIQNADELPRGPFLACMAACHSLTIIEGNLTGDPLDLKMFEATKWIFEEQGEDDTTKYGNMMPTVVKPATSETSLAQNSEQSSYEDKLLDVSKNFHFATNGKSFSVLRSYFADIMPKIVQKGTVFSRMSPDQKRQLVEALQDLGYGVGMCGDGANDCGALKTAHAGISLSETEASVASPFTSSIPNISCVPIVIREGRAALVTSFGVFKYMALYSLIQFISVMILYWINSNLGDIQYLYVDLVITTTVAILMGYNGAYAHLVKKRPPGSLMSPVILISIILQIVIQIIGQTVAYFLLFTQDWFNPLVPSEDADKNILCPENTIVFLVSSFQYFIVAAAFSKGPPYRTPIWHNVLFLISLIVLSAYTSFMLFYPYYLSFLTNFFEVYQLGPDHIQFCWLIFAIIIVNAVSTFALEWLMGKSFIKTLIKPCRKKNISKNVYKTIEREIMNDPDWPPIGHVTTSNISINQTS